MGHRTAAEGHAVLVVAPLGRDAESVVKVLADHGYDARAIGSLEKVAAALDEHVGVILLTEEGLHGEEGALRRALADQPAWSDVPIIFLAASARAGGNRGEAARVHLFSYASNVTFLERPLGVASLVSATASAMRSRQKQFEMRDRLAERDAARADLADSEARVRMAIDAAEIGFWDVDPIADTLYWPPIVKGMFGIAAGEPVSMADFYAGLHPDDAPMTGAAFAAAMDPARRALYDVEYRTVGRDGVTRWVAAKGRGFFDGDRCVRVVGTAIDITARKQAELELRSLNETLEQRVQERSDLLIQAEAALRQSQKMEAVGQLTGGIAHDFNNMLTGIIGGLDIVKRRIALGRLDDLDRFMDAASLSAQRAAALTARLLAFSRRQTLDTRPLDTRRLLESMEDLLRRTLPENIALHLHPGETPLAMADENQLESALLNLAINARDAMPDGGELTIETRVAELDDAYAARHPDVAPGRYVVIAVSDTGSGIAPDIIDKVLDPFFTTKPIGQGTGLGLSMVYGFARQSGGQLRVHSEPGVGTSVSIFLAATDATAENAAADVEHGAPTGTGQSILVVEDDDSVRLMIADVLTDLGYRVIEAEEAEAALATLRSSAEIKLMVSDVGLPGMNGRQLAEAARALRRDMPILFVTGYAENALTRAGFLGANMDMIAKPFMLDALAKKVSAMVAPPA